MIILCTGNTLQPELRKRSRMKHSAEISFMVSFCRYRNQDIKKNEKQHIRSVVIHLLG